ncbi:MAG: polysaccharide biosynthesis tyrosine autokinase [Myxococcales bacterium]|nr:polysaccharide biosynthesis tyrosine autokinase [Myxococcales bacterium]
MIPEQAVVGRNPVDPKFYLRVFWRRRWVVLGVLGAVVVGTAFYTLRQPKIYRSTASIIIDAAPPKVLDKQVEEVIEQGTGSYWYSKEYYQTQYKVIQSRAVAQRVVDKLGMQSDPAFLGAEKVEDEGKRAELMQKADAVARLQGKIKVEPAKDTRLAYVHVEDTDPNRAALLANEVTEAYIAENLSLKVRMTASATQWLEERLSTLEGQSNKSELELHAFKKQADMLTTSLEDRQSMVSQRLTALNAALTEVRLKVAALKARMEAMRSVQAAATEEPSRWAEALPGVTDNKLIEQFKVRVAVQRTECTELSERYLEDHPKLSACREKLRGAEGDLSREIGNIITASKAELEEATAKEKNLLALFEGAKADAFEVNKKQIEFDQLKRTADNQQRLYDLVLKRLKDLEVSGLLRTSNVRVLDSARPTASPAKPRFSTNIAIAFVLGLIAALGLALVLEFMDNTIGSQADVEEQLRIPFLGFVPNIPEGKAKTISERDLHIHMHPKSSVAECCRSIRTNLLFMMPDKPFRSLLVTSSGPQEGKTTSTINLGISMVQSGNKVLLLDTDMRRPRLHKAFGVPNEVGVSTLVIDQARLSEAIKSTEIPDLFVMPCGPLPPNPAELLHTEAFGHLLKQLCEQYDRVILDSPPLGAVADAAVLGTQVDGVLLVLKAGATTREMARRAVGSLRGVNARLFGTVINNVNVGDPKYGDYYYYYYRQYGSYYGDPQDKAVS